MNCRQAQREIALLVGDDINDDDRRRDVERHVASCHACRERQAKIAAALGAMVSTEAPGTFDSVHSLWPGLRRRLNRPLSRGPAGGNWKSWTPFAAGVATCAGLLIFASAAFHEPDGDRPSVNREMSPLYPPLNSAINELSEDANGKPVVRPVKNRQ
jgi:hypothetical protein